jgi:peptide/nickel transport system substrate-binding protein
MRTRLFPIGAVAILLALAFAGCTSPPGPVEKDPPKALASVSKALVTEGEAVTFNASGSTVASGRIVNHTWAFGDGAVAYEASATRAYPVHGSFLVTLRVVDEAGKSDTTADEPLFIRVLPEPVVLGSLNEGSPPRARIAASDHIIEAGDSVRFTGFDSFGYVRNGFFSENGPLTPTNSPYTPSRPDITRHDWLLVRDGTSIDSSSGGLYNKTFVEPGLYTIFLTAFSENGRSDVAGASILVVEKGTAVAKAREPRVVVAIADQEPASLDPGFTSGAAAASILGQTYERLFVADQGRPGFVQAQLASSLPSKDAGTISADGRTYTIALRRDVTFAGGSPMDSSAVKYSIDRAILMGDPVSDRDLLSAIRGYAAYSASDYRAQDRQAYLSAGGVEVVDDFTVRFNLENVDPAFLSELSTPVASILDPKAFKEPHAEREGFWGATSSSGGLPPPAIGDISAKTRDPWADMNVAGSGAFTLKTWSPGDFVLLEKNPRYRDAGAVGVDHVLVEFASDTDSKGLRVESGDADIAAMSPAEALTFNGTAFSRSAIVSGPRPSVGLVWWSYDIVDATACPKDALTGDPDCAFFDDLAMRRAWSRAFDYEREISEVLGGRVMRLAGVFPTGALGHDAARAPTGTDLAAAREALSASRHPVGFAVTLHYAGASEARKETAKMLKDSLESLAAGVAVTLVEVSPDVLTPMISRGEVAVAFIGVNPRHPHPSAYASALFLRDGFYGAASGYHDSTMDRLIDEAVAAGDQDAAHGKWKLVEDRAADEAAFIWNIQETEFRLVSKALQNHGNSLLDVGSPLETYAGLLKA